LNISTKFFRNCIIWNRNYKNKSIKFNINKLKYKLWSVLSRPILAIKSDIIVINDKAIPTEIKTNATFGILQKQKTSFFLFLKTEILRLVKEFYSKKKNCILTTSKEIDKRMNYKKKKNTKKRLYKWANIINWSVYVNYTKKNIWQTELSDRNLH